MKAMFRGFATALVMFGGLLTVNRALRVATATVAVGLAAWTGFLFLRQDIAMALFRGAIKQQVEADLISDLGDGLHVASCGSGTPLPDLTMAGGCTAVIAGGRLFVFDVGEGASKTLARMGLQPARIEAVFITHFHSDHIAGLGAIALQRNLGNGIRTALPLYGPNGVQDVAAGFNLGFAQDHLYRRLHHASLAVPKQALELEARPFHAPAVGLFPVVYSAGGVTVRAIRVSHGPVDPAVGYSVEYHGLRVVISGDTSRSTNLAQAARSADLLVHEGLNREMVSEIENIARHHGQTSMATVMHDIPSYHTSPTEAASVAAEAQVRALAFTHMIPPLPVGMLEAPFLKGVADIYRRPVLVMRDGMVLTIRRRDRPSVRRVL